MKAFYKRKLCVSLLFVLALLLSGCGIHVNINESKPAVAEMLADQQLVLDPVDYSPEGAYTLTVHYDKGGFEKMDLSRAYVAYYPTTLRDQIDMITSGDTEEIPPLPVDAQNVMDQATGVNELQKIAVIKILTVDDQTLNVSFTDNDNALRGREYYFIVPNEGLAGSVIPG